MSWAPGSLSMSIASPLASAPVGQFAEELRSFGPFHLRGLQRQFSLYPFKGRQVFLSHDVSVYKRYDGRERYRPFFPVV